MKSHVLQSPSAEPKLIGTCFPNMAEGPINWNDWEMIQTSMVTKAEEKIEI